MGARFGLLIGGFALSYAGLLFHLYKVQISEGGYYEAQVSSRYLSTGYLEPRRGTIYFTDKRGEKVAVAMNKEFRYAYAVPKDIDDAAEGARIIAPILGVRIEELEGKLSKEGDPFEPLAYKIPDAAAGELENLKLKGVYVDTMYERYYPFGETAAHLVGYVGPTEDGPGERGHYGLEAFYEERLAGVPGYIKDREVHPAVAGGDLVLTIDPAIQTEAERILKALVSRYGAKSGGIIVENPKTGALLAMAAEPAFDPNSYGKFRVETFLNPMVQALYEPGSVFKVLTMAAGIDVGAITPRTTYYDSGSLTLNGRTVKNWDGKAHGTITMTNVIEQSVNTGAIFAQRQTGREKFREYMERFGLDEETGVDTVGELAGDLGRLVPAERDIAFATASYGQGVAVTPLELLSAISAIANEGVLMRPHVNAELAPQKKGVAISEITAHEVAGMMVSAVEKAEVARIAGYTIAGKTGTAFVPDFTHGGYTENVINTYIGFGPASDPAFTILIKLEEPEGNPLAALTVVPAFRELAQFILNYYQIPPDGL